MVKPRKKHFAVVMKSHSIQNSVGSPPDLLESDVSVEDNWVVVKKQRVNILIPSLLGTEQCILLDPGEAQHLGNMHSASANAVFQLLDENPPDAFIAERNDEPLRLSPETDILSARNGYPSADNVVGTIKQGKPSPRRIDTEHRFTALRAWHIGKRNIMGKSSAGFKDFRPFEQSELFAVTNMVGALSFRDKMMKASNLEKKIMRAGGLDRWLSSLGLEQFTRIFYGKKMNKFQLVNLSMKKLKDMGAHSVGPRRKLIHAIECAVLF